ncbi:MAG: hypothetical protein ACI9GZ_002322 [Bacteroidia bacterium]|jgi:hypothetical protein
MDNPDINEIKNALKKAQWRNFTILVFLAFLINNFINAMRGRFLRES